MKDFFCIFCSLKTTFAIDMNITSDTFFTIFLFPPQKFKQIFLSIL